MNKKYTEKRKYTRYRLKDRVLARIQPDPTQTYHLIDISMGGMTFRYLGDGRRYQENILSGDLVFEDKNVTLKDFTFEIKSDLLVKDSFIPMRRCGVQFKNVSPEQHDQLEKFIAHCSSDSFTA